MVTGWGSTKDSSGPFPHDLQAATVLTHTRATCAAGELYIQTSHPAICAGGTSDGGRDACRVRILAFTD